MAVHLFFNPDLVGQLAACGITTRRQQTAGAAPTGFVLDGRRGPPRPRPAVTNVVAERGPVKITARQPTPAPTPAPPRLALPEPAATEPQTALELASECARLRRDNQQLAGEVARLRSEIVRLTGSGSQREQSSELDDAATRFSLLELDL